MAAPLKAVAPRATEPTEDVFRELLERTRRIEERQAVPQVHPMELKDFAELERWAERAARSDMVPYGYKGKPDNIILAVQMGMELGLRPMQSLANIAIIQGRASVWGDAMLALCKMHPDYVSTEEKVTGEGENMVARCVCVRRGEPPVVQTYSVADAKTAKLWGKKGREGQDTPWITNPKRMLQMRARGFALRDAFPDKLRGLISAEEVSDYPDYAGYSAAPPPPVAEHRPAASVPTPAEPRKQTMGEFLDALEADLNAAQTAEEVDDILARDKVRLVAERAQNGAKVRFDAMVKAAIARTAGDEPDGDLGVVGEERADA
jgi:hypothetical protein